MQGVLGGIETVFLALLGWLEGPAWRRVLFLALVAALTILPGLAALPPTDRDESRFAQASRQMIETGDVVDIRFQDAPRWEKPAGIYWLQAAAALPFGGAEAPIWAYRLPSALAAFLGGLLLMWALGPLIGPGAALLSALMFATSLLVLVEAHLAKTDAVLVATVIAAQGALIRLLAPEAPMRFNWRHLVFWGALGAGLLVKGPVALLPAAGTLLWLAVAGRSIAPLRATRPLPGLLVLLALAAPWLVAIWIRTDGAFFTDSLLGDMLAKVAQGKERHWGPPGYYLATIWATFWPWAALILLAVPTLWQLRRTREVRLLTGWLVPTWLVFEIVATKLPHYILPALPAICGLLGLWGVAHHKISPRAPVLIAAAGLYAVPGLCLALAAILALPLIEGTVSVSAVILAVVALFFVALAARALSDRRIAAFFGAALASCLLVYPALMQFTLPRLNSIFLSPRIAALYAPWRACTGRPLAIVGYHEPSLVFAAGTDTELIDAETAARKLREEDGWAVFFEERPNLTLERFVAGSGLKLTVLDTVSGFNYNRGKSTTLFLLARDGDKVVSACAPNRTVDAS